ncbi:hypothetical protein LIA77_08346 [Sarocladium implicatum]|nr:hypothetical protein LIA77_08346 [Sarocladium implicatum]
MAQLFPPVAMHQSVGDSDDQGTSAHAPSSSTNTDHDPVVSNRPTVLVSITEDLPHPVSPRQETFDSSSLSVAPSTEDLQGISIIDADGADHDQSPRYSNVKAKVIFRNKTRRLFLSHATAGTATMRRMARDLFDRYGFLRSELRDHQVRRGSGVWGDELGEGDIFLIEKVEINARKPLDMGLFIFNEVVAEIRKLSDRFVVLICLDDVGKSGLAHTEADEQCETDKSAFFRKLGFRRIGNTSWFGVMVGVENHQSNMVPLEEDFDPPPTGPIAQNLEATFRLDPIYHETEALSTLKGQWNKFPYKLDHWFSIDEEGRSLMHLAAINTKPEALSWLTLYVPDLVQIRDKAGHTPLEALRYSLELKRTFYPDYRNPWSSAARPDDFCGYTDGEVECLIVLINASGKQLENSSMTLDRLRYGCTCGRCIDGFMSPRMSSLIQDHANRLYWTITKAAETFEVTKPHESFYFNPALPENIMARLVPQHMRQTFTTSALVRHGFANLFGLVYTSLKAGRCPSDAVLIEAIETSGYNASITRQYIQTGGDFVTIRRIILANAFSTINWAKMTVPGTIELDIDALPACRNDFEFFLVDRAMNAASGVGYIPTNCESIRG